MGPRKNEQKFCEYCKTGHVKKRRFCTHACYALFLKESGVIPPSQRGKKANAKQLRALSIGWALGVPSKTKGKSRPKYIGRKISKAKKGVPITDPKILANMRLATLKRNIKGDRHWNWKGGRTPINERIRHSDRYNQWRKKVYQRDRHTCQDCGFHGSNQLNAHHIRPFAQYSSLRYTVSNGVTLCRDCHRKRHKKMRSLTTI